MEHLSEIEAAGMKEHILRQYTNAAYMLQIKHMANLKEYIGDAKCITYKGELLKSNLFYHQVQADVSIHTIPTKILEDYYNFIVREDECNAWLRMWDNTADTPEDFQAGLPGINGEIQCDTTKKLHDELRTSPAYREMEVRYLASKLLKGG